MKYELIYIGDFEDGRQLWQGLDGYFRYYNHERRHQALNYRASRGSLCRQNHK